MLADTVSGVGALRQMYIPFIDTIPDEAVIIVTLTRQLARWLRRGIKELLGADYLQRCTVISINHPNHYYKLTGLRGRVMLDPLFVLRARPEVQADVERLAGGSHAATDIGPKPQK